MADQDHEEQAESRNNPGNQLKEAIQRTYNTTAVNVASVTAKITGGAIGAAGVSELAGGSARNGILAAGAAAVGARFAKRHAEKLGENYETVKAESESTESTVDNRTQSHTERLAAQRETEAKRDNGPSR